ncbi:hypothetical protein B7463_g1182, partial [Scytalidium lignicola]
MHASMLSGACTEPSIRHAVVALAALHEATITVQQSRSLSFDRLGLVANMHHRQAIKHYSKAIQIMRKTVASGAQDMRTTLVTCFMIFGFEAFHGNIALAVAQVQTGIALIGEWKENYLLRGTPYSAPDEDVIETFLCLEIQTMTFHDNRPYESHAVLRKEYASKVQNMPSSFSSMWEATKYFYLVKKHLEHFLHVSKRFMSLYRGAGEDSLTTRHGRENLLQEAMSYQAYHQEEFSRWYASFEALLRQSDLENDSDAAARVNYLQLHFKASNLVLQTALATDELIYDDYTAKFSEIISLATELIEKVESRSKTARWTFDLSVVFPLYLVGIKCRFSMIKHQALGLLRRSQRREGIWDNILVWRIVRWIQSTEDEAMEGELIPGWARVEDVQSSFDVQERYVEVKCQQRLAEGSALRERSINIEW